MSTVEMRYMGLINLTCHRPWHYQRRDLSKRFRISNETTDWLIKVLRLDVKGYERKNRQEEITYHILSNPLATAKSTAEAIGCTEWLVYTVAKKFGLTMQNKYSLKRCENFEILNDVKFYETGMP